MKQNKHIDCCYLVNEEDLIEATDGGLFCPICGREVISAKDIRKMERRFNLIFYAICLFCVAMVVTVFILR